MVNCNKNMLLIWTCVILMHCFMCHKELLLEYFINVKLRDA